MNSKKRIVLKFDVHFMITLAVLCCYWLYICRVFSSATEIGRTSDSLVYEKIASLKLNDLAFWGGLRPPVVSFVYKLLDVNHWRIIIFQYLCYAFCWTVLSFQVRSLVNNQYLRLLLMCITLLFSATSDLIMWNDFILSESISISLSVLLIAGLFWIIRSISWKHVFTLSAIAFLWGLIRDANAYLLIFFIPCIYICMTKAKVWIFIAICILTFTLSSISSDMSAQRWDFFSEEGEYLWSMPPYMGKRWIFPFLNVLAQRILPDSEAVSWFEQHGMPVTPTLLQRAGTWASGDDWTFYRDPTLQPFRDWLIIEGKSDYQQFLLSRLSVSLIQPFKNCDWLYNPPRFMGYISPIRYNTLAMMNIERVFYPRSEILAFWGILACFMFFIAFFGNTSGNRWLIPLMMILLCYPHALIVWHGDAMEIDRHALQLNMQLRYGLMLVIFLGFDVIISRSYKALNGSLRSE